MKVTNYRYNATEDGLSEWSAQLISRVGPLPADALYIAMIKWLVESRPGARCLDIGCGMFGRFIPIIVPNAGALVAIEPDVRRFEAFFREHNGGRVSVQNTTSTDYKEQHPKDRFDFILLSMVLQHVALKICDQILTDIFDLLTDEGVAIIATTHRKVERFAFQRDQSSRTVDEFDRYAMDCDNQHYGIPVRYFSRDSFATAIERAGLFVVQWGQFDFVKDDRISSFSSMMMLREDDIKDSGDSQYAVVMRRR